MRLAAVANMTKPDWIHLYISISFWLCLIGILGRLACLVWSDYPRIIKWTRKGKAMGELI